MGGVGKWAEFRLWMLSKWIRMFVGWCHARSGHRLIHYQRVFTAYWGAPRFLARLVLFPSGFLCLAKAPLRREGATDPAFRSAKSGQILPIRESSIGFVVEELLITLLLCAHDLMCEKVRRVYGISLWMARPELED